MLSNFDLSQGNPKGEVFGMTAQGSLLVAVAHELCKSFLRAFVLGEVAFHSMASDFESFRFEKAKQAGQALYVDIELSQAFTALDLATRSHLASAR